jgi:UDP-N-acetylglucosamine 4,6-dehydratase/5-epimerase
METILITGGSGFLGRHLAIKLKNRYRVILGARNNGNNQLAYSKTGCTVTPLDITNINSIYDAINEFKPDTIIHAAATKYVDISEQYPMECIDVNVIGSQNLARIAMEKAVKKVIGVSTDKAAPPVGNIYGHSKAIMERMYCALDKKGATRFVNVRFGNIAWSTGSVFPIWQRMVKENGKIESTGPEQRRFFFLVEEAADLVITAMENIENLRGGILSLKMKAAKIEDILQVWTTEQKISWQQIASRPGDKLDEVLIGAIELPYTKEIVINNKPYYFIHFDKKESNYLNTEIASYNAEKLSNAEISKIINTPPLL